MRKAILLSLLLFLVACGGESEAKEGIPFEDIKETWFDKIEPYNHPLELGELNEEDLTRIGDEPDLLFGVDDPGNVTQIQIISRNGHTAENLDKMIAAMGVLIMTLDEDLTMGIDDIEYIENWLVNNENKELNEHSYRVDGDINDTHYIYAYINNNKE
ncbi:MAG TPA: hypothetical protein VLA13_09350 [Massilibacterium sp.]|nr:hypothetical protein [Massilibacterium sp.]